MKKIPFLIILLVFVISSQSFGIITYSGPLNITVDLSNSATFDFDGAGTIWNPFEISIDDISTGSQTYRTLHFESVGWTFNYYSFPAYLSNIGGEALNFGFGDSVPPPVANSLSITYLTAVDLSTQAISGNFNPATPSGYIGLTSLYGPTLSEAYYGWLHISNITDFGLTSMQATIDGWAFEDQNKVPIAVGAIPAPGAFVLAGFGAGLVAYLRKRRTI